MADGFSEAITHNTKQLGCGRVLDKFPDRLLDDLPTPTMLGRTRVGGVDLDNPRIRAVLALAGAPSFAVADLAAKVADMTGQTAYSTRQAAYDLRKFRGKDLVAKPGRGRRHQVPVQATRTTSASATSHRRHRQHFVDRIPASG
jgi:hypothetical protein